MPWEPPRTELVHMQSKRVIIIGGGFAGGACARTLRKKLPPQPCEIVLFSRENNVVFYPLLAEVAGAATNAGAYPAAIHGGILALPKPTKEDIMSDAIITHKNDGP